MKNDQNFTILIVDDDHDDQLLTVDALKEESAAPLTVHCLDNGEMLIEYLTRRGRYRNTRNYPPPDLILLDLNMPRLDGREVLRLLKTDPKLRRYPVVVLTTSQSEEDIVNSYDIGVNSVITKPSTFPDLKASLRTLGLYWFKTVTLPPSKEAR